MASSSDVQSHSCASSTWSEASDHVSMCDTVSHSSMCESQCCPSQATNATGASLATLSYQPFDLCVELCSDETKECPTETESRYDLGNSCKQDATKGSSASQDSCTIPTGISAKNGTTSIASTSFLSSDCAFAESWCESGARVKTSPQKRVAWNVMTATSSGEESSVAREVEYFPSWAHGVDEDDVSVQNSLESANKQRRYAWLGSEQTTDSTISSVVSNGVNCPGELHVEDLADESVHSGQLFYVVEGKPKCNGIPKYSLRSKVISSSEIHSASTISGEKSSLSNILKHSLKKEKNACLIENMAVPFALEPSDSSECTQNITWPSGKTKKTRRWRDVAEVLPSVKAFSERKFSRRISHKKDSTEKTFDKCSGIIRNGSERIETYCPEPDIKAKCSSLYTTIKCSKPLEVKNNDVYNSKECDKCTNVKQIPPKKDLSKTIVETSEVNSLLVKNDFKTIKENINDNNVILYDGVDTCLRPVKREGLNQERQVFQGVPCFSPDISSTESNMQTSFVYSPRKSLESTISEQIIERKDKSGSVEHDRLSKSSSILQFPQEKRSFNESTTSLKSDVTHLKVKSLSNINNCADTDTKSILLQDEEAIKLCGTPTSDVLLQSKENSDLQIQREFINLDIKQKTSSTSSTKDSVLDSQKSSIQSEPFKKMQDLIVHNCSEVTNMFQNNDLDALSKKFANNLYISSNDDKHNLSNIIDRENKDVSIGHLEWYTAHHELSANGILVNSKKIQDIEQSNTVSMNMPTQVECKLPISCKNSDSGLTLGESRNESEDQLSYNVVHCCKNESSLQTSPLSETTQLNRGNVFEFENLSVDHCASKLNICGMPQPAPCTDQVCCVSKNKEEECKHTRKSAAIVNPLFSRKRTYSTTVLVLNNYQPFKKIKRPSSSTCDTERMFLESTCKTNSCRGHLLSKLLHNKNSFRKEHRNNRIIFGKECRKVIHGFANKAHRDLGIGVVEYQNPNKICNGEELYRSNNFIISEIIPQVNELRTVNIVREHLEFTETNIQKMSVKPVPSSTQQNDDLSTTNSKQCSSLAELSSTQQTLNECNNQSSTCLSTSENYSHDGESSRQESSSLPDPKMFSDSIPKGDGCSRAETCRSVNADSPVLETHPGDCRWQPSTWSRKKDVSEPRGKTSKGAAGMWLLPKDDASSETHSDGAKRRPSWWTPKPMVSKRVVRRKRKPAGGERALPAAEGDSRGLPDAPRCRRGLLPLLSHPPRSPVRRRHRRFPTFDREEAVRPPPAPIFRKPGTSSESISPVRDFTFDGHRKISRQVSRSFLERSNIFSKGMIPSTFEKYSRYYKQLQDSTNLLPKRCKSGKKQSSKSSSKSGDTCETGRSRCFFKRSAMRISLLPSDHQSYFQNSEVDFPSTIDSSESKHLTPGGKSKSGDQLGNSQRKRKRSQNLSKSFSEFQTLKKQIAARSKGFDAQMLQSSLPALPGTCLVPVPILQPRTSWIRRSKNLSFHKSHPILSPTSATSSSSDLAAGYTLVQGVCASSEGSHLPHSVLPLESVVPLTLGSVAVPQLMVPVSWQQDLTQSGRVRPPGDTVPSVKTEWLEPSQVVSSVSPAVIHVLCIQPVAGKRCEK